MGQHLRFELSLADSQSAVLTDYTNATASWSVWEESNLHVEAYETPELPVLYPALNSLINSLVTTKHEIPYHLRRTLS